MAVKDLSRLGRDFIETGYYLEQIFPSKHVRFISIGDNFDTIDGITDISHDGMLGIRIPITNIFNEKVVEDIRAKTQSSIDRNIREGKYVGSHAPYGYTKLPDDCHKLVPDHEAVKVVKYIFDMASKQIGLNEIVRRLNSSKIPTPIDYARANGLQGNYGQGNGLWNTRTVKYILTNRAYIGGLLQGKDQIVVQDTHEPIISHDIFDVVQKSLETPTRKLNKITNTPRSDNPLRGKVICGSCGGKLQRRKGSGNADWHFFTCISNNRLGTGHCTGMYIRESEINEAIRSEVKRYVEVNEAETTLNQARIIELATIATTLNESIQTRQDKFRDQYEEFVRGVVEASDLESARTESKNMQSELRNVELQIGMLNKAQEQYQLFYDLLQGASLTEGFITAYLKDITVYDGKRVEVSFNQPAK